MILLHSPVRILTMPFHFVLPGKHLITDRAPGLQRFHIVRGGHVAIEVKFLMEASVTDVAVEAVDTKVVVHMQTKVRLRAQCFTTFRTLV